MAALGLLCASLAPTASSAATITYVMQGSVLLNSSGKLATDLFGDYGPKNAILTGKTFQSIATFTAPSIYPAYGELFNLLTSGSFTINNKTKYFYPAVMHHANALYSFTADATDPNEIGLNMDYSSDPSATYPNVFYHVGEGFANLPALPLFSQINASSFPQTVTHAGYYFESHTHTDEDFYLYISAVATIYSAYGPARAFAQADLSSAALSAVPLPTAAPLFGAALIALGAVGCRMKRRPLRPVVPRQVSCSAPAQI